MLVKQRDLRRLASSFSPYRVIACYAIFFVVRADCDSATINNGIISDDILLRRGLQENTLSKEICDVVTCERVIIDDNQHHPRGDFPIPSVEKDYESKVIPDMLEQISRSEQTIQVESRSKEIPYDNIFAPIPVFSLASNGVQNGDCRKHSRIFLRQLKIYRMWALQMFDASAKLPSGVLRGNVNQLGDFDECLSVDSGILLPEGGERVRGKYCLASVDITVTSSGSESLQDAVYLAQAQGFIRSKLGDPGHFIPRFTSMNWAFCVPASCQEMDVQDGLARALQGFNGTAGLQLAVEVEPGMCYEETNSRKLSTTTLVVISLYALVAVIAVIATVRDKIGISAPRTAGKLERTVMAFSLRKNISILLEDLPADGDIHCIHGIRTLCTVALYLAHKVITLALIPYVNRVQLTQVSNDPMSSVLRASIVYTDTFLMLSGVLTAYHLTREVQRKGSISWVLRFLNRFIRLTPALVALTVFYAYVFEHMGQGPQWGRIVTQNADICRKNMWRNILYIQNFFPFEEMCATHTHQLALDMQLSVLAPPLVYLLHTHPVLGTLLLLTLNCTSVVLRYVVALYNNLSLVFYHGMPVSQLFRTANLMYSLSSHRATPYLMGVGLGFFLKKTGKNIYIPKPAVVFGWLLAAALAYYSLFSRSAEASQDFRYDVHDASLYAACGPIAWALALGWLIFACFTGHGGGVNTFLSCRTLVVLSRISYCVYLTQFAVFFYNVGVTRTSEQFTLLKGVDIGELVVVLVLSVVATLLFDLPMQEIKGILICSDGRSRGHKKTDQEKLQ